MMSSAEKTLQKSSPGAIKDSLKNLERETRDLWHLIKCREKSVDAVDGTLNATEGAIQDLMNLIGGMEHEINQCTDQLTKLETRRVELLEERDSLQEKVRNKTKISNQGKTSESTQIDPDGLASERAMRDEARVALFQKTDELELAMDRRRQVNNEITKEWATIRDQVYRMNDERKSVVEELNSVDTLRIDNLNKMAEEGNKKESMDSALQWLKLCKEERDLQLELGQLEFDSQYQINETTTALGIKKGYMNHLEEISREYHEMLVRDGADTGFYVRETNGYPDLPNADDYLMVAESTSDLLVEDMVDDTRTLHHCSQRTDIHQNLEGDAYLMRHAAEMERNMAEYMRDLNLDGGRDSRADVEGTLYPDTEVNLQDAALDLKAPELEDSSREPELPQDKLTKDVPAIHARKLPGNMESSHVDQSSITAKIRGRLGGVGLDRSRVGSHTVLKGSSIRATGSGMFTKLRKK